MRRRASWDVPDDLEHARDVNNELEDHGRLRRAVTKERDTLTCMHREETGNELCDDTDCTHCVLTDALNGGNE